MVSGANLAGGMVGSMLAQAGLGFIERALSYIIVEALIVPEYQKLTLKDFVKKFVKEPIAQTELLAMLDDPASLKPTSDFVEFLKDFNLGIARKALQIGIVSREAGNIASRLLSAIQWSYGFGWLSWVGMSPILNAIVANPANAALRAKFRPKDEPRSVAESLYKRGIISEDELKEFYKKEGYTDKAIKRMIWDVEADMKKEHRQLSRSLMLRAFRLGMWTKGFTIRRLQELGYSYEDAEKIVEMEEADMALDSVEKGRDLSKSDIIKAYEKGIIDKEFALMSLERLGYSPIEALLLLKIYAEESEEGVSSGEES